MPARVLASRALLFVLGCLSLVFIHPNSIFEGVVFLLPFTVSRIISFGFSLHAKVIASVSFVAFVFFVWSALYSSVMFHGVVSFEWPAYLSGSEAIGGLLVYSLTKYSLPQIAMAVLVFVGCCIYFAKRSNRWIVVSLAVSAAISVAASSSEGDLKHLLAGFWYTDTFRIASMVVIASIPLASIGLNGVIGFVKSLVRSLGWDERESIRSQLCDYTIDDEVKAAVEDRGIRYVLLLDKDDFAGERMETCTKDLNAWRGIMGITDETKGFEVVLAQGDMRLYRLTDV